MSDHHAPIDGAHLAYRLEGAGSPLVWLHGLLGSRAAEARSDLYDIASLARRHRLLRYDARGHGHSTGRPHGADYRWPAMAADLFALLDFVQMPKVDIGGASLGAATTLWAAIQAPQRFRRLVLVIPPVAWQGRPAQSSFYRRAADLVEREGAETFRQLAKGAPPPDIFADHPTLDFTPDVADALLPSVFRGAAASDLPDPDEISTLDHPALILAWETDSGHPVTIAERLAELLPSARLQVCGTSKEVQTWNDRIAQFLSEGQNVG